MDSNRKTAIIAGVLILTVLASSILSGSLSGSISELVPRWLSIWGLIGAILILAMGLLRLFGYPVIFLAIPIILNELVLAILLIAKGFNSSAIASESVKTAMN
jgi:hypothetical protein